MGLVRASLDHLLLPSSCDSGPSGCYEAATVQSRGTCQEEVVHILLEVAGRGRRCLCRAAQLRRGPGPQEDIGGSRAALSITGTRLCHSGGACHLRKPQEVAGQTLEVRSLPALGTRLGR